MAQYFTDFSEYTIGEQPVDWTKQSGADVSNWVVIGTDPRLRGSRSTTATTVVGSIAWDAVSGAELDTVEVLYQGQYTDLGGDICNGAVIAGHAAGIGLNRYPTVVRFTLSGSRTILGQDSSITINEDELFWVRFRKAGTLYQLRVWLDGSPEPSTWNVEVSDAEVPSSFVGAAFDYTFTGDYSYFDNFGVGTNGDPAPTGSGTTVDAPASELSASLPPPELEAQSAPIVDATGAGAVAEAGEGQVGAGGTVTAPHAAAEVALLGPITNIAATVTVGIVQTSVTLNVPDINAAANIDINETAASYVAAISPALEGFCETAGLAAQLSLAAPLPEVRTATTGTVLASAIAANLETAPPLIEAGHSVNGIAAEVNAEAALPSITGFAEIQSLSAGAGCSFEIPLIQDNRSAEVIVNTADAIVDFLNSDILSVPVIAVDAASAFAAAVLSTVEASQIKDPISATGFIGFITPVILGKGSYRRSALIGLGRNYADIVSRAARNNADLLNGKNNVEINQGG